MKKEQRAVLQLLAGEDGHGQQVLEKVHVFVLEQADHYEVMQTPLLIRGLAKGDIIEVNSQLDKAFKLVKHSGNLAVRVFRKTEIEAGRQS